MRPHLIPGDASSCLMSSSACDTHSRSLLKFYACAGAKQYSETEGALQRVATRQSKCRICDFQIMSLLRYHETVMHEHVTTSAWACDASARVCVYNPGWQGLGGGEGVGVPEDQLQKHQWSRTAWPPEGSLQRRLQSLHWSRQ